MLAAAYGVSDFFPGDGAELKSGEIRPECVQPLSFQRRFDNRTWSQRLVNWDFPSPRGWDFYRPIPTSVPFPAMSLHFRRRRCAEAGAGADADADEDGEREAADSAAEEPEREGRPTPTGNQRRPQPRLLT